jgi:hypothetical protein
MNNSTKQFLTESYLGIVDRLYANNGFNTIVAMHEKLTGYLMGQISLEEQARMWRAQEKRQMESGSVEIDERCWVHEGECAHIVKFAGGYERMMKATEIMNKIHYVNNDKIKYVCSTHFPDKEIVGIENSRQDCLPGRIGTTFVDGTSGILNVYQIRYLLERYGNTMITL